MNKYENALNDYKLVNKVYNRSECSPYVDLLQEAIDEANKYDLLKAINDKLLLVLEQRKKISTGKEKYAYQDVCSLYENITLDLTERFNNKVELPQKSSTEMFEELKIYKKENDNQNEETWIGGEIEIEFDLFRKNHIIHFSSWNEFKGDYLIKIGQAISQFYKEKGWLE